MRCSPRSFDVFDTSLTRMVGQPAALFQLHGHLLVRVGRWSLGAGQYASARVDAEARARLNSRTQDVTLAAIYRELAVAYNLSEADAALFMEQELKLEEEFLRPVPQTVELLREQRELGARILFVSDTYLSASMLKHYLIRFGLAAETDSVWSSSDAGFTKGSGDLFKHVLQHEQVAAGSLLHIGDSKSADVAIPKSMGIRSEWFDAAMLTPREILIEKHTGSTAGIASLLSGASRWVRLSVQARGDEQRALRAMAAEVAGPVMSAFLLWVIEKSHALGIKRLMFVARDGQVMLRMAKPLAAKLNVEFDMRYLYANRHVVNLAGLRAVNSTALDWITEGAAVATLGEILERVGVDISAVAAEAKKAGLPGVGMLGQGLASALRDFLKSPTVSSRILESAQQRREFVQAYFADCGLMDGTPCAVIDIGWKGRVFGSLCEVIGEAHAGRHTALYFGLFAKPEPHPLGRQEAYLFDRSDPVSGGRAFDIDALPNVMEIFSQADHGQVLAVEHREGRYMPVLRSETNDVGSIWDVPYFQDCLTSFASALSIDERWCTPMPDLRAVCEMLLRELITRPSRDEAFLLGSFQYVDGPNGSPHPLARPYQLRDAYRTFRSGVLPRSSPVWWEAGALAMTPESVRTAIKAALRLSRVRSTPIGRALRRCRDYWASRRSLYG